MLNVAHSSFGTTVYCDKPTNNFHCPSNLLLSSSDRGFRSGLLCAPVAKPPVNILFRLSQPVPVDLIVIKPNVGRHKVSCLSVFLLRDATVKRKLHGPTPRLTPEEIIKRFDNVSPLISVKLDTSPPDSVIAIRLSDAREVPPTSCLISASSILSFEPPGVRPGQPHVRFVLIRVTRLMGASSIPCMGVVELWSFASGTGFKSLAREQPTDNKDVSTQKCELVSAVEDKREDASINAPEDFLDALTGDLMIDPIRLPSGSYVDRTSLHRFWSQRSITGDSDVQKLDPFTMTSLNEAELESDEGMKQAITKYLDRLERLNSLCEKLDNRPILGVSTIKPSTSKFVACSTEEKSLIKSNRL